MSLSQQLAPALKQLRLSGILDSLEVRNQQAVADQWSYLEFLTLADPRRGRAPRPQAARPARAAQRHRRHEDVGDLRLQLQPHHLAPTGLRLSHLRLRAR